MSFVPDPNQRLRYYNRTRHSRQRTNPLFIVEVARAALTAPCVSIPGTVHILIESRVDARPEGPRHALEAAAVVGVRFSLPEL